METYTKQQLLDMYELPLDDLISISHKVTEENFDNTVEACSIISAKTGACGENCKYCSQSKHNHAEIECHPLLDVETIKKSALSAKENGATRFCIVTSGRVPTDKDFEKVLRHQLDEWSAQITESTINWKRDDKVEFDCIILRADEIEYSEIKRFVGENESIIAFSYSPLRKHVQ